MRSLCVLGTALTLLVACQTQSDPPKEAKPKAPPSLPQIFTEGDVGVSAIPSPDKLDFTPESNPAPDPSLTVIEPTEQGVRAWIHATHKRLASTVLMEKVVLDFDTTDEVLVRVPFKPNADTEWQWVMLLDKRGESHAIARAWAEPGVDARARVISSGTGERGVLLVETQGKDVSMVEVVRLDEGGVLTTVARLGGSKARYGTLEVSEGPRPTIVMTQGGQSRRWKLRDTDGGLAVVQIAPAP